MRVTKTLILAFLIMAFAGAAYAADIMLPSPERTGGPGVLQAISNRASAKPKAFEPKELEPKELSTILWAATGKNRDKGWTVPMARGSEPYITVYALLKTGSYEYDWADNKLLQLGDKNMIRRSAGQEYVQTAPCVLVFATKGAGPRVENWAEVAVGAMTQNVYLACEALGLKARYVAGFNNETLLAAMQLSPLARIIAIMPVGYQK
jgi:nitroreductase